jgi:hypothetical protein
VPTREMATVDYVVGFSENEHNLLLGIAKRGTEILRNTTADSAIPARGHFRRRLHASGYALNSTTLDMV